MEDLAPFAVHLSFTFVFFQESLWLSGGLGEAKIRHMTSFCLISDESV